MNDVECLASSAIDFAPGVWFNPLLDSGNGFRAVFAGADSDCIEFRSITKRDPPISFGDAERSQCRTTRTVLNLVTRGIPMLLGA